VGKPLSRIACLGGMSNEVGFQREIARLAPAGIGPSGFALAGSGAIREHGVTDRPTEDVDLCSPRGATSICLTMLLSE
jgi:hypothetical protein